MKPNRLGNRVGARLGGRSVLIGSAIACTLVAPVLFYAAVRQAVENLAVEPSLIRDLLHEARAAFIPATILLLAVTVAVTVLIAHLLITPLQDLRHRLNLLTREDQPPAGAGPGFAEQADLEDTIKRHFREAEAREESLLRSRVELETLLEFGAEGLVHISGDGRFGYVNPAARQLLSLPAYVTGQPMSALVRHTGLRELIASAIDGHTPPPRDILLDDRQLVVIGRTLPGGAGAVIAILDLTEVRRLENVRRDFVANVSHELKTPLTSIRGYSETLIHEQVPAELRLQFLEVIHQNAARIQRIIDDLLDLSRLESGGWHPNIESVDVIDLAEDTWSACKAATRKEIRFDVRATGGTRVAADPGGLRQVLANLFDNAIRYTPDGGEVTLRVHDLVNGRAPDVSREWIELLLKDTGVGIPRDALPRIFERFYRVNPARSRDDGGTGLGLSIVRHLVERMGGDVRAESEQGKGTTIRITLPAA